MASVEQITSRVRRPLPLGQPALQTPRSRALAAARELHNRALRNRSQVAFHTLRIGLKRFRYIVENFLPIEHKAWSNDFKEMQDLLGDVHDLDVFWATAALLSHFSRCRFAPALARASPLRANQAH